MAYSLPYTDGEPRLPVSTKCPSCKKVTDQEFIVMAPVVDGEIDPNVVIAKSKRLAVCTECGDLRLSK